MENEKKFEFSEMYIFGKFDTFSKRLMKITEMFETFETYSHLSDSKIEGKTYQHCSSLFITCTVKKYPLEKLLYATQQLQCRWPLKRSSTAHVKLR